MELLLISTIVLIMIFHFNEVDAKIKQSKEEILKAILGEKTKVEISNLYNLGKIVVEEHKGVFLAWIENEKYKGTVAQGASAIEAMNQLAISIKVKDEYDKKQ